MCCQKNGEARDEKEIAGYIQEHHKLSNRRACALVGLPTCTTRYQSHRIDDASVRARLKELAQERPRFSYRRLGMLLRREGYLINSKRVCVFTVRKN